MTIQFRNSQEKLCLVISIPHLVPGFFTGLPGLRATQSASTRTAALSWSWVQPNAMRKKSSASPRSDTHPSGTNSYVRNFNKPFIFRAFHVKKVSIQGLKDKNLSYLYKSLDRPLPTRREGRPWPWTPPTVSAWSTRHRLGNSRQTI